MSPLQPLRYLCVSALSASFILPAAAAAQSAADYVIGPGDVLTITMYDQTELSGRYNVGLDGTLSFPLIGRIKAAGLRL